MNLTKEKINKLLENVECDRAVVFYGTGWPGKPKYFDLERKNRIIKKGIEILHVPYSEHSSPEELLEFKRIMKHSEIYNLVRNKHHYHNITTNDS